MTDPFAGLVGQDSAVAQLRASAQRPVHAYLFVGPTGVGKRQAALGFASLLLNDERALRETHPDLVIVEREGASISVAQAREIARLASLTPADGSKKVLLLTDFHLVDEAAPALLKTIEEASESTVFLILAESVPHELVTVASRCVRIDFRSIPTELIEQALVDDGVELERAKEAAIAAFGNLDRARLLAVDDSVSQRHNLWANCFTYLDGSGAKVAQLVDEIISAIDHAAGPLLARHEKECDVLAQRVKEAGGGVTMLKNLETRQKREQRRLRTDELRSGFATLSQELSKQLSVVSDTSSLERVQSALGAVSWANESLNYNPNETLLLQGLFVRLPKWQLIA